jgi:3-isopropylmalate/(R)-2-methylmalate dehydratase large subunit
MAAPATLFDKIWSSHAILVRPDGATLLHIDRHLVHDGSGNAFRMLKEKGLPVRRPDRTFATPDHYVSTLSHDLASINVCLSGFYPHPQHVGCRQAPE